MPGIERWWRSGIAGDRRISFRVSRSDSVPEIVDHLFRHQAGQMVSSLTRLFGVENIELAEDVVQETLVKALQQWTYRGIPENPEGWLWQTAKNHALDILRREVRMRKKLSGRIESMEPEQAAAREEAFDHPLGDDQLSMMFIGCHPSLSRESQVALLLKTVGGFNVAEIARAFLVPEATIAQRLVRAKNKLRMENVRFELPQSEDLTIRLDVVLEVLYSIFNEGYESHSGEALVRKDLCLEAIYLCGLLVDHAIGKTPKAHALLSLMLLQASRLDARTDEHGNILLMAEQNRGQWNHSMIKAGMYYLGLSAEGEQLTEYHLQAAIAARHATAADDASTDWAGILEDYETLKDLVPSPVVLLNYAVALANVHGSKAGLRELTRLKNLPALKKYHLLYATFGELYARCGDAPSAMNSYREAIALTSNATERHFLEKKLKALETNAHPS